MITKVTKENKVLYKALFEKATKDLFGENPQFVVDSLDKYFSRLTTLSEKNPIYTVLPLDEPTFDIDTNTRIITVPADFSKNGVSVQGDEVSEVIYFTVDRYVDTMDLFREDIKIAIQWETAPDSKNQTLKGISPEYLRDITTYAQQGKMLFGWALRSDITKNPGTIKFSVRFYHRNTEGQLDFSLNTLTASAVIKPSLDYKFENGEFEYDIIDSTNLIKGRLEDSVFNDKTPGKDASEPTFAQDIPLASDIQGNPVVDPDERVFLIIDLKSEEPKEGEQEVLYYDFQAQAYSDDEGVISYRWGRADLGSKEFSSIQGREVYVPTKDIKYSSNYNYYEIIGQDEHGEPLYGLVSLTADQLDKDIPQEIRPSLYVKVSQCRIGSTGDYRVIATNGLGFSTASKESSLVRVPGPDAGSFTITSDTPRQVLLIGENVASATFEAVAGTAKNDKISYIWLVNGVVANADDEDDKNQDSYDKSTFVLPDVAEEDRAMYEASVKVQAKAFRNGASITSDILEFRVTDNAHEADISVGNTSLTIVNGGTKLLEAETDIFGRKSDYMTYQWFKVSGEIDNDPETDDDADDFAVDATPVRAEKLMEGYTDKYDISREITLPGTYYCKVTNHLNGSSATTKSTLFHVSPI